MGLLSSEMRGRFLRFCVVGAIATGIQYALLYLFLGMGMIPELASGLGFAISAVFNYAANRRLTFGSDRAHVVAFPRFLFLAGCGLGWNSFVLSLCYRVIGLPVLLSQVLATCVVVAWNFLGSQYWVFRKESQP